MLFTCPASSVASDRSGAGVPTWRYQYQGNSHFFNPFYHINIPFSIGVFPDISQRPDLRAFHAADIPIVFGTYNASTISAGPTPPEIALSRLIQTAWVTFATDPAHGLKDTPFSWPRVNDGGNNVVLLGNPTNPAGATFASSSTVDVDCDSIDALVALYNLLGIIVTIT